jgi:hypothetical protein
MIKKPIIATTAFLLVETGFQEDYWPLLLASLALQSLLQVLISERVTKVLLISSKNALLLCILLRCEKSAMPLLCWR